MMYSLKNIVATSFKVMKREEEESDLWVIEIKLQYSDEEYEWCMMKNNTMNGNDNMGF